MANLPRTSQQRTDAVANLARSARRWGWPTIAEPDRRLLDFTPANLAAARIVLPELLRAYAAQESGGNGGGSSYARSSAAPQHPANAQPLHLVVLLREPVARTRSHFCMAASNSRPLLQLLRTERTCRHFPTLCQPHRRGGGTKRPQSTPAPNPCEGLPLATSAATGSSHGSSQQPRMLWTERCANDTGYVTTCLAKTATTTTTTLHPASLRTSLVGLDNCTARFAAKELFESLPRIAARWPMAVQSSTGVGPTSVSISSLASELFRGRGPSARALQEGIDELRRVAWPAHASCPMSAHSYGWESRNRSIVQAVRAELQRWGWLAGTSHKCANASEPRNAIDLPTSDLLRLVRSCKRDAGMKRYVEHTAPVFQLSLLLRALTTTTDVGLEPNGARSGYPGGGRGASRRSRTTIRGGVRWTFMRFEHLTDPGLGRYGRIRWLAHVFNLSVPSREHVNRSRGCDFSRRYMNFGRASAADDAQGVMEQEPPETSRSRAAEDREVGTMLQPWHDVLERLVQEHGGVNTPAFKSGETSRE